MTYPIKLPIEHRVTVVHFWSIIGREKERPVKGRKYYLLLSLNHLTP